MQFALLIPFFFYLKEGLFIEDYSYEEYKKMLETKKEIKKQMFELKLQIFNNKFNQEIVNKLLKEEQYLHQKYKDNEFFIRTYELKMKGRDELNEKHKGK